MRASRAVDNMEVAATVEGTAADELALASIREHARQQVAHRTEATGDGLLMARAGESTSFMIRLPEKPQRFDEKQLLVARTKQDKRALLQARWADAEAKAIEDSRPHVWATIKRAPGAVPET